MRIAIVSREVFPLSRGGIGAYVTELANVLRADAEVTLVTSDLFAARHRELVAAGDPELPHPDVRIAFVREPREDELGSWFSSLHLYSARVLARLRELFPDGGPDVAEFSDYLAEGAVTVQAARTRDPGLHATTVVVKLHTTAEICDVLDGRLRDDVPSRVTYDLERYAVRFADQLLFGGGDVLGTYGRFFGSSRLAPGRAVRQPVPDAPVAPPGLPDDVRRGDAPVRLLYFGRFERRKGVHDLVKGLAATHGVDFRLTMVGGDTDTAPLGASMRGHVALMASEDERFALLEHVDRREVPGLLAEHHAVVVPSAWECWPNVGLEALRANRPLIATPVGGLAEMAGDGPGFGGWLARDTGPDALADVVTDVVGDRERLAEVLASRGPRERFEHLTDPGPVRATYRELAARRPRAPAPRPEPLVSVVVPYFQLDEHVTETVESVVAQTHRALEVVVVDDGSFRERDAVLDVLAERFAVRVLAQPNSGLSAARNAGIAVSRGRYVLTLDADDVLHPTFVERCVACLEADPSIAYATSWLRYVDERGRPDPRLGEGWQPYSNASDVLHDVNTAGSAIAVFRRRLFANAFAYDTDLTSYEDWVLFRELRDAGHVGHVIPERLIDYRIRAASMMRQTGLPQAERIRQEVDASQRRKQVEWTSSSA